MLSLWVGKVSSPEKTVDDVWKFMQCKLPKPKVLMRSQRRTGLYWPNREELPFRHTITLREDSWKKMTEAEKKLTTIHESLHACGVSHQPGFRTSLDEVAHIVYLKIYGADDDWKKFEASLNDRIEKFKQKK